MSQSLIDLILSDATPHQFIGCLTDGARRELVAELRELVSKTTTPTPPRDAAGIQGASHPRRLREYVSKAPDGVGRRYRVNDGVVEVTSKIVNVNSWMTADTIWRHDIEGVADLLANPDEPQPVETLEEVIGDAFRDCPNGGDVYEYTAKVVRAWLATQPQTITPEQAVKVLVEHGAKRCQFFDVHGNGLVLTRGGLKGEQRVSVLVLPEPTP